jgi:hypothetical protein
MRSEPTAPDVIPEYIVTGIDRQDQETLEEIEKYARQRREYLEAAEQRELDEEDLADSDEALLETEASSEGTVVIKKVSCGKDCSGCPHGPYKYVVSREGEDLNWEYKGRVDGDST